MVWDDQFPPECGYQNLQFVSTTLLEGRCSHSRQSCKWWRPKSVVNSEHPRRCVDGGSDFSPGFYSDKVGKTRINHPPISACLLLVQTVPKCVLYSCFNHIDIIVVCTVVTIVFFLTTLHHFFLLILTEIVIVTFWQWPKMSPATDYPWSSNIYINVYWLNFVSTTVQNCTCQTLWSRAGWSPLWTIGCMANHVKPPYGLTPIRIRICSPSSEGSDPSVQAM